MKPLDCTGILCIAPLSWVSGVAMNDRVAERDLAVNNVIIISMEATSEILRNCLRTKCFVCRGLCEDKGTMFTAIRWTRSLTIRKKGSCILGISGHFLDPSCISRHFKLLENSLGIFASLKWSLRTLEILWTTLRFLEFQKSPWVFEQFDRFFRLPESPRGPLDVFAGIRRES